MKGNHSSRRPFHPLPMSRLACDASQGEIPCKYWNNTKCVRNFKIPAGNIKDAIQAAELGTYRPCPFSERGQKVLLAINEKWAKQGAF